MFSYNTRYEGERRSMITENSGQEAPTFTQVRLRHSGIGSNIQVKAPTFR